MTRTYFGTDGIRGTANRFPMTPEVALRVGLAAGRRFMSADDRRHLVVIGKDTRLSGYMLEPALTAGFTAAGMDVVLFGPLPTPAVAMLTRSLRADLGVMLSASHNKFVDNGIKLFVSVLDGATVSASHEWAEAATDPYPEAKPAWEGLGDDDLGWELMVQGQDENGDLCEFDEDSYGSYGAPAFASMVQRQWSNASAAAGHAPCVPAPQNPYFNVALLDAKSVAAKITRQEFPWSKATRGYAAAVGQSVDVALGFVSDAATAPFTITATELDPFDDSGAFELPPEKRTLTLSLDKTTGQNGEKAYLHVQVDKPSASGNVHLVLVDATLGQERHTMPIVVVDGP